MRIKPHTCLVIAALAAALGACSQTSSDGRFTPREQGYASTSSTADIARDAAAGTDSSTGTADETEVSINANNLIQTRTIHSQTVQLIGDGNRVTFAGESKVFSLTGNSNDVKLDNVKDIEITGDNNTVIWRGTRPYISTTGKGNVVRETK
ncbi:DUF3060 domain-containing protein [Hymenobacter pini]|uniref:DUF3060 domain-containing protein n=1 Tax=Hymenobacter pini TaxID=2880879 RepID=UPI001CF458F7|nr:DUF3060 domain-containing protein [Hymenobacter pini]MCA8829523.1 DUF3060 domain-containing protein [Hymenobacter pini]